MIRLICLVFTIFLISSCENKEKKYFSLLGSINGSVHSGSLEALDKSMKSYSSYIEKTEAYGSGSFLSEAGITQSVEFINCVERFQKNLVVKSKEGGELQRWTNNLKELQNPLKKRSLSDPEKVFASIEQRIEGINDRIRKLDVVLNDSRIKCDNSYSKLVSLYK